MPRMVGVFESSDAVDGVIEQLELNGVTQSMVFGPELASEDLAQQVRGLGVPDEQIAEYRTRLQNQRWLLFVQVAALELPMVQRALRSGQAIDIDLLPESMA